MANDNDIKSIAEPYALAADLTLKELLGPKERLDKIFSEENISRSQALIDEAKSSFFESARPLVTSICNAAKVNVDMKIGQAQLKTISQEAQSLRQQADTLSFPFVVSVCSNIELVARTAGKLDFDYTKLIRELTNLLTLAFQMKIIDEGGGVGHSVIEALKVLSNTIKGIAVGASA
jgi:hypothetical protein